MATLVLGAVGASLGSAAGGALGSAGMGMMMGRLAGSVMGRALDDRVFGQDIVKPSPPRILEEMRINSAQIGRAIPEFYGRTRMAGEVIWASHFRAHASDEGYEYTLSFALAFCKGVVHRLGRVWANGQILDLSSISYRFYEGRKDQNPDPLIARYEGEKFTPSFHDMAYIVFEDFPISQFSNHLPTLEFELFRHGQNAAIPESKTLIRGLSLIPGTGEYALSTTPVLQNDEFGAQEWLNLSRQGGLTDFSQSLNALVADCPNVEHCALVVSWFGNDLRMEHCHIAPACTQNEREASAPWQVSGQTRENAKIISRTQGASNYGGTPSDQSVIEAIKALHLRQKSVTFYPFILMDIPKDNNLPNPYNPAEFQAEHPWRGRITTQIAPGLAGSLEGQAALRAEIENFLGKATVEDFALENGEIRYFGAEEWGYRRFILHYAYLCKLAGGVEQFLIGSELRGLTSLRAQGVEFPFVEGLIQLAKDVRQILGSETKISYAADWSEYFGYQPAHEDGSAYFHLDALWADEDIDFIGIDNYMPLSDWREKSDHKDAHWGSVYHLDYLKSQVTGGEGYDYYYADEAARLSQNRTEISDAWGEEWIWRFKDLESFWSKPHFQRVNNHRLKEPTAWKPFSKPFVFCEYGAAAVHLATNEPNKFLDEKSAESDVPHFSHAHGDAFIQAQYICALNEYWQDLRNNPRSPYDNRLMVDMSRAFYWCYDTRPWPEFPARSDLWSDGANFARGHWINSRINAPRLANVIYDICLEAGVENVDVSKVYGLLLGVSFTGRETPREKIELLMRAFGFQGFIRDNRLIFRHETASDIVPIDKNALIESEDGALFSHIHNHVYETASKISLHYINGEGEYERQVASRAFAHENGAIAGDFVKTVLELPMILTQNQAQISARNLLLQAQSGREYVVFRLAFYENMPQLGDVVKGIDENNIYRIIRVKSGDYREYEALKIAHYGYEPDDLGAMNAQGLKSVSNLGVAFIDAVGESAQYALAAFSDVPQNPVQIWENSELGQEKLHFSLLPLAQMGKLVSPLPQAERDRRQNFPLRVELAQSRPLILEKAQNDRLFFAYIGQNEDWELMGFEEFEPIGAGQYLLKGLYRASQSRAMNVQEWPVGTRIVFIDKSLKYLPKSSLLAVDNARFSYGEQGAMRAIFQEKTLSLPDEGGGWLAPKISYSQSGLQIFPRDCADRDFWLEAEVDHGDVRIFYKILQNESEIFRDEYQGLPLTLHAILDPGRYEIRAWVETTNGQKSLENKEIIDVEF